MHVRKVHFMLFQATAIESFEATRSELRSIDEDHLHLHAFDMEVIGLNLQSMNLLQLCLNERAGIEGTGRAVVHDSHFSSGAGCGLDLF
jgi:hypothetical protein